MQLRDLMAIAKFLFVSASEIHCVTGWRFPYFLRARLFIFTPYLAFISHL